MQLHDKVAVVTGGSRGIGRSCALALAMAGSHVAIGYRSRHDMAQEVVREVEHLDRMAIAVEGDLAEPDSVRGLIRRTVQHFGRIDILVNNAGVFLGRKSALEISDTDFDYLIAINLRATFVAAVEAAQHMLHGGRIINLSSGAARWPQQGTAVYAATKAGVEALTRCLAVEVGRLGITVNSIAPGIVETEGAAADIGGPQMREVWIRKTALRRLGQPTDIASIVLFLASDDAGWITGQVIDAHGGLF